MASWPWAAIQISAQALIQTGSLLCRPNEMQSFFRLFDQASSDSRDSRQTSGSAPVRRTKGHPRKLSSSKWICLARQPVSNLVKALTPSLGLFFKMSFLKRGSLSNTWVNWSTQNSVILQWERSSSTSWQSSVNWMQLATELMTLSAVGATNEKRLSDDKSSNSNQVRTAAGDHSFQPIATSSSFLRLKVGEMWSSRNRSVKSHDSKWRIRSAVVCWRQELSGYEAPSPRGLKLKTSFCSFCMKRIRQFSYKNSDILKRKKRHYLETGDIFSSHSFCQAGNAGSSDEVTV